MSRSRSDQRGKRIAGEIGGRGAFAVVDGRLIRRCGGESVGSPARKRDAKDQATRMRRREGDRIARTSEKDA